ncbi:MAG TPA: RecX family transcriptional regulator [Ktedonobacterales bacterium]|nr:RecX family transcriptional regulator [Ktedonobacterales bacterium]
MKITAIETQARRKDRRSVFIDGTFALALNEAQVLEFGLFVGREVSQDEVEQWRAADLFQQTLDHALNFLTFRPRSREEVRRNLYGRRTSPELIEQVLAKLEEMRVLSDQQFAEFWVENREQFNPRGARALSAELRQRGVDRETIEATVAPERDEERALAAAQKKLRSLANADYQTFRKQLGGFLLRRGFSYGISAGVVRQLWEQLHQGRAAEEDEGVFDEETLFDQ